MYRNPADQPRPYPTCTIQSSGKVAELLASSSDYFCQEKYGVKEKSEQAKEINNIEYAYREIQELLTAQALSFRLEPTQWNIIRSAIEDNKNLAENRPMITLQIAAYLNGLAVSNDYSGMSTYKICEQAREKVMQDVRKMLEGR